MEFLEDNPGNPSLSNFLVSIVIPLYNEEKSIKSVINNIPRNLDCEIIVIDDGSTDNSLKVVKEINREVIVIEHEQNKGYGASILTGFEHAKGDIIVTMDSDGQHDPNEILQLIQPIIDKEADIVIGSRYLGKSVYKVPLHTRVGEWFVKICLWILYHQKISNNQSGFRAFTNRSITILSDMVYTKFGLCTETLFKAGLKNLKMVEIPITIDLRKYGSSYVKVSIILKSILSCIIIYSLAKLRVKGILPNRLFIILRNFFEKVFKFLS